MAENAKGRGHTQAATHFEEQARVSAQHAGVIRDLIESGATSKNLEPSRRAGSHTVRKVASG